MTERRPDGPWVVTGGAGGIGSVLVERLLREGRTVEVVDDFSSGRADQLPRGAAAQRLRITTCHLGGSPPPEAPFRGAAELWHLAANADVRRGATDPQLDLTNGTVATAQVLEAARRGDVPRVVFSSSSVVYGLASVLPTPETYGPLVPESLYGAAKLAAEGLVSAYAHTYGLTAYIFRFANIIDGRMRHGILYDLFEKLRRDPTRLEVLGDGSQAKSYLRTEDCVQGMLVASRASHDRVQHFNLGADDQTTVREIAEKVVAAHGGGARIVYGPGDRGWVGDVPRQRLSIAKMRALGWAPSTSSTGAIDRTIAELLARAPSGAADGGR
jgi:UDP-glucose 4-epimerase